MEEEVNKVKFYSVADWASGYQLQNAEKIIKEFDKNNEYGVVELLEFYNIIKYIDNKMFLRQWSDEFKENAIKVSKEMKAKIFKYFDENLNDEKFTEIIKEVPNEYIEDLLEILEKKIDKINISEIIFIKALKDRNIPVYYVLYYEKIVKKYDKEIRNEMMNDINNSAEIILKKYYINEEKYNKLKLPKELSLEDKENLLIKYLDRSFLI